MSSRSPARDLRASDSDRDRVLSVLTAAVSDGRLTHDEFSQRASLALSAKTLGDLAGLTADLVPSPLVQLDGGKAISAYFGTTRRDGRWIVPETLTVTAVRGTVEVDFREAILRSTQVRVNVTILVGHVYLHVPEGIRVEISGRALLGGYRTLGQNAPALRADPESAVLDVHALVLGGKLVVRTPPRPRRFRLFPRRG